MRGRKGNEQWLQRCFPPQARVLLTAQCITKIIFYLMCETASGSFRVAFQCKIVEWEEAPLCGVPLSLFPSLLSFSSEDTLFRPLSIHSLPSFGIQTDFCHPPFSSLHNTCRVGHTIHFVFLVMVSLFLRESGVSPRECSSVATLTYWTQARIVAYLFRSRLFPRVLTVRYLAFRVLNSTNRLFISHTRSPARVAIECVK